jgi:hypothetical protein
LQLISQEKTEKSEIMKRRTIEVREKGGIKINNIYIDKITTAKSKSKSRSRSKERDI